MSQELHIPAADPAFKQKLREKIAELKGKGDKQSQLDAMLFEAQLALLEQSGGGAPPGAPKASASASKPEPPKVEFHNVPASAVPPQAPPVKVHKQKASEPKPAAPGPVSEATKEKVRQVIARYHKVGTNAAGWPTRSTDQDFTSWVKTQIAADRIRRGGEAFQILLDTEAPWSKNPPTAPPPPAASGGAPAAPPTKWDAAGWAAFRHEIAGAPPATLTRAGLATAAQEAFAAVIDDHEHPSAFGEMEDLGSGPGADKPYHAQFSIFVVFGLKKSKTDKFLEVIGWGTEFLAHDASHVGETVSTAVSHSPDVTGAGVGVGLGFITHVVNTAAEHWAKKQVKEAAAELLKIPEMKKKYGPFLQEMQGLKYGRGLITITAPALGLNEDAIYLGDDVGWGYSGTHGATNGSLVLSGGALKKGNPSLTGSSDFSLEKWLAGARANLLFKMS